MGDREPEASSAANTEESGERFIKNVDSRRQSGQTGVGKCALHPCLTRRATLTSDSTEPLEKARQEKKQAEKRDMLLGEAGRTQSEADLQEAEERPQLRRAGSQLWQRRRELAQAGLRHTEATAQAVRTMERGLAESVRSGADTPTVDLVQTAVSVREVSKLIGRTVVQMSNVRRIMIVTKPNDTSLVSLTRDLAVWLAGSDVRCDAAAPMLVYVEESVARHRNFGLQRLLQKHAGLRDSLQFWTAELCASSPELFDFVVTLGGDGTVLYTSWLFQTTVPPIIAFHLGSLGFLTVFDHRHARRVLGAAINAGVRINLRMRFTCTVYRLAEEADPEHANVLVDAADCNRLLSHEIATHGLQSGDEHLCETAAAKVGSGSPVGPLHGARPDRARRSASRTHLRRRSSANHSSSGAASEPRSSGSENEASLPVPALVRKSSATVARAAAAASSCKKPDAPAQGPQASADHAEHAEPPLSSEWDDVPKMYQRRMRKVWRRGSTFQVMNEVVVDRGPSPYLAQLELYGDGTHLTTVEADGLCLATPTGSTAYSLAAGGSLVHPEIPAILVTPICAHTLSFRPMLLPDSMVLRVVLPPDSRNTAWASFDGRHRIELRRGDHIQITASKFPLPTVCATQSQTQDWMSSLSRCLNWNERQRQKRFSEAVGVESDDEGANAADEGSAQED
ncbi:hypothetical protein LPJ78_000450 [Coemansia sp. RSA 989]|nr:ATP-NAD kinase-like domain-containing protein [Coemansia mojavensis]KAJ1753235.1 hypothetical protein LPJ79_000514 [Coemansia sp. RSA 1821]KAJ1868150.1 hypothetical protein LPJ78_000450 [Coemansia sp. RSA 989]KAJ1872355.1 hypothetical protein LPJ55_003182 [Coemansia sp. RSA 990]KAJ2676387.1 hypothetical protein IWW42_000676 [Coemansia sp. RSA 1085]